MLIGKNPVLRLTGLSLALAALAGCGPLNRSYESVHVPVVTKARLVHDVPVRGGVINAADAAGLDQWFAAIRLAYGDRVSIDDPLYGDVAGRRDTIGRVVAAHGLLLQTGGGDSRPATPGTVRVIVDRAHARVDNCPDWRRASQPELSGSTTSNFGCATKSNLAAMIADPNDLVSGKPYDGTDPAAATKAIEAWRKAPPTGTRGLNKGDIKSGGSSSGSSGSH